MIKKLLLSLGAALLTVSASAATFKQGEAFAYKIDPSFSFDLAGDAGDLYVQYPAEGLRGQASLEYGFGMASAWFNGKKFATPAAANEACPVVADPWNANGYAIRMQTASWDGFGNFNFALPQMNEPCRVRVIYRVDHLTGTQWATNPEKPFHIKLMDDGDQDTPDYPELAEDNSEYWNNPGWRVADFVSDLASDQYYISLLWDAGGLSCGRNMPFYVMEVSVVPMSKLAGYTAPADNKSLTVVTEQPDFVTLVDNTGDDSAYKQGEAFAYEITPSAFSFDLAGDAGDLYGQYPVEGLRGQASMEYGFGMASAWFNARKFATPADANTDCPVVDDPWKEGSYAIRMQTTRWDGFGNFNFALPEVNEPSRIRVIYRVDNSVTNEWYTKGDGKKLFRVKLMDDGDQDTYDYPELTEDNADFWDNPGWRVADFVNDLADDHHYLSILWDGGGLSCQRNVPFYVMEVSVVPMSKLTDYTAPADNKSLTVVTEQPEYVVIDRSGAGVEAVDGELNAVAIVGMTGTVAVNGFEGTVEVYNLVGQMIGKAAVNGAAEIAVPAGVAIVKAGSTVAKVIVR